MMTGNLTAQPWRRLQGKISSEVLGAPKTEGDQQASEEWPRVHDRIVTYLERHVLGKPWADHLALVALVLTAQRYDVGTLYNYLCVLHPRFKAIFSAQGLQRMEELNLQEFIPAYLKGEVLPQDTKFLRSRFCSDYLSVYGRMKKWLEGLPTSEQLIYQPFLLPEINSVALAGLYKSKKEVKKQAREHRKTEADAVVPFFAELRAQAHLRFNKLVRLRQAYQQALVQMDQQGGPDILPLTFSYEEGGMPDREMPPAERLYFRLWDQCSFVSEHLDQFGENTRSFFWARKGTYSPERRCLFLELIKVERLVDSAPPEGLWFEELLRLGMLGKKSKNGTPDEITAKQRWLRTWGYGEEDSKELVAPFNTQHSNLLSWGTHDHFLANAQERTNRVLFLVEPLYAAGLFGLLATNLFTTTGMRINEAMQVRTSKDCLVRLLLPPPPEAKDQSLRVRYLLRLIPKGERTPSPHSFFIGDETKRLLVKTGQMLLEHYSLKEGEAKEILPTVPFSPVNHRSHRFDPAPYLFQYDFKHMSENAITASMRFLLHGMVFRTQEGMPVVLNAHLLRHAFATHAVQVEKIPVDIVGNWLKQKSLDVTKYYSEATESIVKDTYERYLISIATHLDIGEAVIRSPEHLQRMYEAARNKVGTFAEVIGGECTDDNLCPIKFNCIGCPAKVPNPAKRPQLQRRYVWTLQQIQAATEEGLVLEAARLKQHARDCASELREMDQIEAYRRDEQSVPEIHIEPEE